MTFEEAFRRINGRAPSDTEVKDALALSDVLKQADLDPMLLLYLADVKAKDERERMVLEMRSIAGDTVSTIRAGLPTNPEWAKAASWAVWFSKAMKAQAGWVMAWGVGSAIVVAAIVILSIVVSWRNGYDAGWTDNRNREYWTATQQACRMLNESRHNIEAHHAEANALRATMTQYGCQ